MSVRYTEIVAFCHRFGTIDSYSLGRVVSVLRSETHVVLFPSSAHYYPLSPYCRIFLLSMTMWSLSSKLYFSFPLSS